MVSHWSLSDSKSSQVSRTFFSILADVNITIVWMVFIRPLISKSYSPWTNPSLTVPRAPITIAIIVTFILHGFFNSLARSRYLSFFSFSVNFTLCLAATAKSTIRQVLFFVDYYKIWGCPWCNGYRRRKWTRRHEFKSWTRPIAFHIALIPMGKVWIQ